MAIAEGRHHLRRNRNRHIVLHEEITLKFCESVSVSTLVPFCHASQIVYSKNPTTRRSHIQTPTRVDPYSSIYPARSNS